MKHDLARSIEILSRTPQTLRTMLGGVSESWTMANYGPDTWSPYDVVGHLIHAERTDWITRARWIQERGPSEPFPPFDRFAQERESVGKAKADYERVVEWTVGTSSVARKYSAGEQHKDEMWDVLVFKNPFQFPMTTAPAMVVENGRFNGQRTAYWTNIGEEATLKVTKSLSIRAVSREQEDSKANERVVVDDKTYTKIFLKGELIMSNHRKQAVKLHVRHSIRGVINEIDGAPKAVIREDSLENVNRVHDVVWTVTLNPGEEKRLTYKNSVLVYR